MTRYLVDTNHASEFFKAPSMFTAKVKRRRDDFFGFCPPVAAELWFMVFNSRRIADNRRDLEQLLTQFEMWPFDPAAAEIFGEQKVMLRRAGRSVADVDLQIASIALVNGLVVLTSDTAFGNVPALKHENWL